MRRIVVTLLSGAALVVPLVLGTGAQVQAATISSPVFINTGYWCDGNGSGSCMSLKPHTGVPPVPAPVFAYGISAGAWQWDLYQDGNVGANTFTYGPEENALDGLPIYILKLHADNSDCNRNSAGGDVINTCDFSPAEQWVSDGNTGYLVNVGRSNDQDNWEVLCNPGGGGQLLITTRDACTTYHKEWAEVIVTS